MKELIIACKTLERELKLALKIKKRKTDIIWIESGLHNTPEKLTNRVGEELEKTADNYDRVILCFGTCGNFMKGLRTGNYELVVPRVDDCISLLLGSVKKRMSISEEKSTYFLTKGWIEGELNIWVEYKYAVDKYGQEEADELFDIMLSGYIRLGILDTGAYDIKRLMDECREIADGLKLELERLDAGLDYINEMIEGPYTRERFIIIGPNADIKLTDLDLFDFIEENN